MTLKLDGLNGSSPQLKSGYFVLQLVAGFLCSDHFLLRGRRVFFLATDAILSVP